MDVHDRCQWMKPCFPMHPALFWQSGTPNTTVGDCPRSGAWWGPISWYIWNGVTEKPENLDFQLPNL